MRRTVLAAGAGLAAAVIVSVRPADAQSAPASCQSHDHHASETSEQLGTISDSRGSASRHYAP
jgi:hypothetical protein